MLTALRRHTLAQVARFNPQIDRIAREHSLDKWTVVGIIAQESAGNPYAVRCEPGFWRRYGKEMVRRAVGTADPHDDRWMRFPDIAAASYGLMQVMYQTALERFAGSPRLGSYVLRYPTELCDPDCGIQAGCRYLAFCLGRSANEREALLKYNGGGDLGYPERVLSWAADARVSGLFRSVALAIQ